MTLTGKEEIENELKHLITVEREKLKVALQEARALGDLKENAEYHSAKERQSLIEGKILDLQSKIARARIVDVKKISSEKIIFGATVTLFDAETDKTLTYQIVGEDEANLEKSKISYMSPLGKALIGREEGDTVTVNAPKGAKEYEVESFEYR